MNRSEAQAARQNRIRTARRSAAAVLREQQKRGTTASTAIQSGTTGHSALKTGHSEHGYSLQNGGPSEIWKWGEKCPHIGCGAATEFGYCTVCRWVCANSARPAPEPIAPARHLAVSVSGAFLSLLAVDSE